MTERLASGAYGLWGSGKNLLTLRWGASGLLQLRVAYLVLEYDKLCKFKAWSLSFPRNSLRKEAESRVGNNLPRATHGGCSACSCHMGSLGALMVLVAVDA